MTARSLPYRPDIDGLRAIAVMSVVLFHLDVPYVTGGFVGVDVFFVISGYLISQIIFRQTAAGTFSFTAFYDRRARRILPAFLVISLLTAFAAYKLFFPAELVRFARSWIAASFFGANIYDFASLNYFSPLADRLPLLHTWSLGVEEQFYLVFPMFIIAVQKFLPRHLKSVIVTVALASYLACAALTRDHPALTFYLLPFRAFELLTGSFIALPAITPPRTGLAGLASVLLGLLCVLGAIFGFNGNTEFPGYAAGLPCIGTALIIWGGAGPATLASRLLGTLPFTVIGRISYSLYLVHWPVIVFGRQLMPGTSFAHQALILLAISGALAAASYQFVEQSVRTKRFWSQRALLSLGLASLLVPAVVGLHIIARHGFPKRYNAQVAALASYLNYDYAAPFRRGACFLDSDQGPALFRPAECFPAGAKRAVLWGDSTAAASYAGLAPVFAAKGYVLAQATASGCEPILGHSSSFRPLCGPFNRTIFPQIMAYKPSIVILSSMWYIGDDDRQLLTRMLATMQAAGIETIIIGPKPFYRAVVPNILADRLRAGNHSTLSTPEQIGPRIPPMDAAMAQFARTVGVRYISVLQTLCNAGTCQLMTDTGVPMDFDNIHFTVAGSRFVADRMADAIWR